MLTKCLQYISLLYCGLILITLIHIVLKFAMYFVIIFKEQQNSYDLDLNQLFSKYWNIIKQHPVSKKIFKLFKKYRFLHCN